MIQFFSENTSFVLKQKSDIKKWIDAVIRKEKKENGSITYVFTSDDYLLELNEEYLNHDTLTDIITFDYSKEKTVSGDIFISIERVKENALKFGTTFDNELRRVMVHGILHLLGYKDKKPADKKKMREKEDFYLNLFNKKK